MHHFFQIMIIVGATTYKTLQDGNVENDKTSAYITILCVGVLFEIVAIAAFIMYFRFVDHYFICFI